MKDAVPTYNNSKKLVESRKILPYMSNVLDEKRTVHFNKGIILGDGYYLVEISSL